MRVPVIPPPVEQLGACSFAFDPAIANTGPNEWIYSRATWSDILVVNAKTEQEIWVPRRFLGAVAGMDEPPIVVGLLQELEYRDGRVGPRERRLIEMPLARRDALPGSGARKAPAPVVAIQLEGRPESRAARSILTAMAAGIASCILLASLYRGEVIGNQILQSQASQTTLPFTHSDDYNSVVRKLGQPEADLWRSGGAAVEYRVLAYSRRGFSVVLMSAGGRAPQYIGAVGRNWQPIHSVELAGQGDSYPLLLALPKS